MPITVGQSRDRLNTRTVALAELTSAYLHGTPYDVREFSTLNEKLGILSGVNPTSRLPEIKFFAVGIGGMGMTGTASAARAIYYQHSPEDAALFEQVPFCLRTLDNDLLPAQRSNYALRKEISIGGVTYVAYYLRRINLSASKVVTRVRNIKNGAVTESDYVVTAANLSPQRNVADSGLVNVTEGNFLVTSRRMSLSFTESDVQELMNVFNIMYAGDLDLARISEIAICSGIDHNVQVTSPTGNYNFTDAARVQVMAFLGEDRALRFNTSGWGRDVDVGGGIPMRRISV